VLFSPGRTLSRLYYSAMVQNIAGADYAVVLMDHAYEAINVEHSDGSHVSGKPPSFYDPLNTQRWASLLATRVEDARFVLTQLGNFDVISALGFSVEHAFDTSKAVIIGHSWGDSTTVSTLMKDPRFVGAVNMDSDQYHDEPLVDVRSEMDAIELG
jgi:dienelactone hydrolase